MKTSDFGKPVFRKNAVKNGNPTMRREARQAFVFAVMMAASNLLAAPPPNPLPADDKLAALSLEELTRVEVTSVARKDQQLLKTPAAVFVITAEDIRRSGLTSVPELLRMVPGIEVAQINSSVWAVSARGFNGREANKILVLVDGRSVYNGIYSGTLWNQNEVPLENIERIEVIRGPGATMWGANAVDGVISVITRKARDTQGFLVSSETGQNDLPQSHIRYGGHVGERLQYRLYTSFGQHPALVSGNGSGASDRWSSGQGGARVDWQISDRDSLTFDGAIHQGSGNQLDNPVFPLPSPVAAVRPFNVNGGFGRVRWERQLQLSSFSFEASYTREAGLENLVNYGLNTADLDFQHRRALGSRNDFVWGGGFRFRDDIASIHFQHPEFHESLYSGFAQDEFSIIPGRLSLTGGVKIQGFRNTVSNAVEAQPQVRLLWTPDKISSVWTSVSRAVRTPSQLDRDVSYSFALPDQNGIPASGMTVGNPAIASEVVIAYEGGYRRQLTRRLTIDAAVFYNHFSRLIGAASLAPEIIFSPLPAIVSHSTYVNGGGADTHGIELASSWTPARRWRFQGSYARETAAFPAAGSLGITQSAGSYWSTPKHVFSARSSWDATRQWSFDSSVYGASSIPTLLVPAYVRVDVHVARRFGENGEFTVGIRNLLDERHLEFRSEDFLLASYIRRSAFAKILWRF